MPGFGQISWNRTKVLRHYPQFKKKVIQKISDIPTSNLMWLNWRGSRRNDTWPRDRSWMIIRFMGTSFLYTVNVLQSFFLLHSTHLLFSCYMVSSPEKPFGFCFLFLLWPAGVLSHWAFYWLQSLLGQTLMLFTLLTFLVYFSLHPSSPTFVTAVTTDKLHCRSVPVKTAPFLSGSLLLFF